MPDAVLTMNGLLSDAPVSNLDASFGTGSVQISEGCACFCSFCAESFCRKPYTEAPAAAIVTEAVAMKANRGLSKIDLYSFNFNMHSEFYAIMNGLSGIFPSIGLKSQRFDMLSRDPEMLPFCLGAGKTSITCGLEGISRRLRAYLHKSLTDADLQASLGLILSSPVRELKLFCIATGKEDADDLAEFGQLILFIKERANGTRIIFSTTPLVRFPHTPLEFEDAAPPEELFPIIAAMKSAVTAQGFEFRASSDLNDYLLSQILVRARDARVYAALRATLSATGYAYYRSVPSSFVTTFARECNGRGLPLSLLLSGGAREDATAPWLVFETGVRRDFLVRQADAARDFVDNGYCLGGDGKAGSCKGCGACGGGDSHPRALRIPRPRPVIAAHESPPPQALGLLVGIPYPCRGLPRQAAATAIASAIMMTCPECVIGYVGYSHSLLCPGGHGWLTGDDIITLRWRAGSIDTLVKALDSESTREAINLRCGRWAVVKRIATDVPQTYRITAQSPYPFRPNDYFIRRGLTHLLRKTQSGYTFEFSKQALKKKLITHCDWTGIVAPAATVTLTVTAKFDAEAFAKEAFVLDKSNDWIRIGMDVVF